VPTLNGHLDEIALLKLKGIEYRLWNYHLASLTDAADNRLC